MAVKVECTDIACRWWSERDVPDIPLRCPECGADVVRATGPEEPDETKSDKV